MKKILFLLLISTVGFAQIPRRISTVTVTEKIVYERTKSSHGFAVGDWLTIDNSGEFVKGSDPTSQEFMGIVSAVTTNTFDFVKPGGTVNTLSGLTAGQRYFAQTDGTIGTTATDMPVGIAVSTTTLEMLMGTFGTTLPPPSNQATLLTFSDIASTTVTASWTRGNTDGFVIFLMSENPISTFPSNNVPYTDGANFGDGDDLGGGVFVMYVGTESTVAITGLTAGTLYYGVVLEFITQGFFTTYNTTVGTNGNNFTTLSNATTPTQQFVTTSFRQEEDRIRIQGTRGNGDNIVVIASTEGQPDTDIADGADPTAGTYGAGTAVGNGYIVYEGSASDFHITGFSRDRMVWWKIMEREDTGFLYNTQSTIDSAWLAFAYDSLFTNTGSFADWTPHQTIGFTASTVNDTLNLSGNPAGYQDYMLYDDLLPDSLEEVTVKYTVKISGALTTSTIGTGPMIINDVSSEANRAVYVLFITDTDSPNFGKLQLYSGNGTSSSPTSIVFRSQSSGAFSPAQDSIYSISLTRTIENDINAFYTASIIDLYDSSELTTSWLESNSPSSAFIGTSIQVGIYQNGGPFKINPFSVTRIGLDDIVPAGGGSVQYEVFVEKTGLDTDDCSEASPCLTAVRAAERVGQLGAGTDVYFGPGTYTETSFVVWPTTLDTLDGAGDTQTIFKGASNLYTDISSSGNGSPFSSYGYLFNFTSTSSTNVTTVMRNFTMEGNRDVGGYTDSMKGGIRIFNRDQINLENVDLKNFWNVGMWVQSVDSLVYRGGHLYRNGFSNVAGLSYSLANIELNGGTTRIWIIDSFIDSPNFNEGRGLGHTGNGERVDIHCHGNEFIVGGSSDAEDHHFASEILAYSMQAGDSISFKNNLLRKNISFGYTGVELGVHYFANNRFNFDLPKNLAIEAQFGNAIIENNYFSNIVGKCIGTYNSWGVICPRDCNAANQVWDGMIIRNNIIELANASIPGDAIFGDQNWRRDDVLIENNTIQFTTTSGTYSRLIRGGTQGVNDNWIVQNNAIHGQPPAGSTVFSTANGSSTFTNSFFRYNKATNLDVTQLLSGNGMTESNNTVTGSGNTLLFNLTGAKFPITQSSYFGWTTNAVLSGTGQGGASIGAYEP